MIGEVYAVKRRQKIDGMYEVDELINKYVFSSKEDAEKFIDSIELEDFNTTTKVIVNDINYTVLYDRYVYEYDEVETLSNEGLISLFWRACGVEWFYVEKLNVN